jgi:hypothetical protein
MAQYSIDKMIRDYIGETEFKDACHVFFNFLDFVGWKEMKTWSEFFGAFKLPQLNPKDIEQRVVANLLHYRFNYFIIMSVITFLVLIFSPILLLSLLLFGGFSIYFLVFLKSSTKMADMTITPRGKRYICVALLLVILFFAGGVTRILWITLYCITVCGLHMVFRPRSVTSQTKRTVEDLKQSGFNWLKGISEESVQDSDPENPPERGDAHDISGYGTADTVRRRTSGSSQ